MLKADYRYLLTIIKLINLWYFKKTSIKIGVVCKLLNKDIFSSRIREYVKVSLPIIIYSRYFPMTKFCYI